MRDYDVWVDLDLPDMKNSNFDGPPSRWNISYEYGYSSRGKVRSGFSVSAGQRVYCGDEDGCRAYGTIIDIIDNDEMIIKIDWKTYRSGY